MSIYILMYEWFYIIGDVLYSKVYVIDNVNCKLDIVVFNGVVVEIILLQFQYFFYVDENFVENFLFEDFIKILLMDNINKINICLLILDFYFEKWNLVIGSCVVVVFFVKNMVRNGGLFLILKGSIK